MMKRILETVGAHDYEIYLTGSNNFRNRINPEYKANREGKVDPRYRQDANAYLVTEYGGSVTDGFEADDALGIRATELMAESIVCSIDKDLLMIPGDHYNWRKNEFTHVTPLDGLRCFYRQLLTGDRTDNIFGVRGLGPVKSAQRINHLEDEADMFQTVQALYNDDTRLLMNGQCLWILREENKLWEFPFVEEIASEGDEQSLQE